MHHSYIAGVGHYVPANLITNEDLAQRMNTSDAWIQERTGIRQRYFYEPGVDTVASMGARASELALERAGRKKEEIDFIVFATITPDYYFPGSGVLLQREMGLGTIGALDIRNQCSAFVYGLSIADQFIKSGMYKCVLVVGAEIQSSLMEMTDEGRSLSVIFGDGAGAALVCRSEEPGILSTHLHADGRYAEELIVKEPSSSMGRRRLAEMAGSGYEADTMAYMNGNAVFKHAISIFPAAVQEALGANGKTIAELDLLIPHQANRRITQHVGQTLGLPESKVVSNVERFGNTTAASIPIAMSEAWAEGRLQPGHLVCLAAFGSGFTWGSALLYWR